MNHLQQLLALALVAVLCQPVVLPAAVDSAACACLQDVSCEGCPCTGDGSDAPLPPVAVVVETGSLPAFSLDFCAVELAALPHAPDRFDRPVLAFSSPPASYCGRSCVLRL